MSKRLPPLNALRVFEVAARRLNFTRAAEELHVTNAAVSHQIKLLEDFLGLDLFQRSNNVLKLTEAGEVVKSGGTVSGVIEGLEGRPFALFLVSETGGASNLKDWISTGSDGTASFKFSVTLAKGAPPAPQLLLVIATDTELAKLAAVPNGVTAKSLMPFVDVQLKDAALNPTTGLGFFRLEN